jgi:hypothetical protein
LDAALLKRSFEAFAIAKVAADTPAYPQYSQN